MIIAAFELLTEVSDCYKPKKSYGYSSFVHEEHKRLKRKKTKASFKTSETTELSCVDRFYGTYLSIIKLSFNFIPYLQRCKKTKYVTHLLNDVNFTSSELAVNLLALPGLKFGVVEGKKERTRKKRKNL